MKQVLYLIVFLITCSFVAKSQPAVVVESIFSIEKDSITSNSEYIEPLFFDYQNQPYTLFRSIPVNSPDNKFQYTVKLSDYNVAIGDGGFFRIIDVTIGNKSIFQLNQSNGWDILPSSIRNFSENGYFFVESLRDSVTALIFCGYPYNSEPRQLTIVILNKGVAKLVFNKQFVINKVEKTNSTFCLTLHDKIVEYIGDDPANTTGIYKLWKENGVLKFGGPYGTASSNL